MNRKPGRIIRGAALIALAGFIAYGLAMFLGYVGDAGAEPDFDRTGPRFVALSAIGLVLGASLVFARPHVGQILSAVAFWGGLAMLLVVGYSMRYELEDVARGALGNLVPGMAVERADGTVALSRDRSGHYVVNARVDGAPVRFLVDTGASVVTLSAEDAAAAGLDIANLNFGAVVATANGRTQVAPVRLARIEIAGAALTNVRAFVARPGALDTSLFGMNALDRFSSWKVENGRMVLTP